MRKLIRPDKVLNFIMLAWAAAWCVVAMLQPSLWPVAMLGFVQNVAFTFVSRGRNSGSLGYHLLASIFSNGIYAVLLFTSIDIISQAKSRPIPFLVVYTLSTMSGSIFAHWLALRAERGKARNVQQDSMDDVKRRLDVAHRKANAAHERLDNLERSEYTEGLVEFISASGLLIRVWSDEKSTNVKGRLEKLLRDNPSLHDPSTLTSSNARFLAKELLANAVQFTTSRDGFISGHVAYRNWP